MNDNELKHALECAMQTGRELDARLQGAKRLIARLHRIERHPGYQTEAKEWLDKVTTVEAEAVKS